MKVIMILVLLLFSIWIYKMVLEPTMPKPKPVAITIPDSRISGLELKIKNLENWAQRQGMKY